MTNEDKEPKHEVPCKRCTNMLKRCTGLPNHVCGPCRKAKAKCEKLSRHGGKGGSDNKDKGKALGKWFSDPRRCRLINQ